MLICTVRAGIPSVQYFTLLLSQTQYDLASQTVVGANRPLHNNNQQNHHHRHQDHLHHYYHHNIIIIVARTTWRWLIHNNSSQNPFHFHLRNARMLGLVFNV